MVIKPIETRYNGYRFRSRLEARTAVLLDAVNLRWVYEPEGFAFEDGTTYLPDFFLPDQGAFLECKGVMYDKDLRKIMMLSKETNKPVIIMYADLTFQYAYWQDGCLVEDESWICRCHRCKKSYFGDKMAGWECQCCGYYGGVAGFDTLCNGEPFLREKNDPTNKAKSARFEFGEEGN